MTTEEKLNRIKEILAEKNGVEDSQEFGLSYSQTINYLNEIEMVLEGNHMKKFYIDSHISYCYPYDIEKATKHYGVLSEYIGKYYTRNEIDKIICELIAKRPYIENAMWLKLCVMWREGDIVGYHHVLTFRNYDCEKQSKGSLEIKYEK